MLRPAVGFPQSVLANAEIVARSQLLLTDPRVVIIRGERLVSFDVWRLRASLNIVKVCHRSTIIP
jgi:hypothetical protein